MTEPHPIIKPQPGILDIATYVAGESRAEGVNRVSKLSSNENPHGPSKLAIEAYAEMSGKLAVYPDSGHRALRDAIAEVHGLNADQIICGAGSDEVIAFLCQSYAGPGDEVLYPEHGFSMYRISAMAAGATPVEAAETNRTTDVDKLLEACNDRTRLVFVANPNNPTGTMIDLEELARLADNLPEQALLVIDGAYAEFVERYDSGAALVDTRDNVVMTRTFSKIYGLGGLRVGWGYGPAHAIDVLNRVRGPFNLSSSALAAAEAAVRDTEYTRWCRDQNNQWRDWLASELASLGVPSDTSFGNFILARFEDEETANACDLWLRKNGLIVRNVKGYKLPQCLRITVGDEVSCTALVRAIKEFMEGMRA